MIGIFYFELAPLKLISSLSDEPRHFLKTNPFIIFPWVGFLHAPTLSLPPPPSLLPDGTARELLSQGVFPLTHLLFLYFPFQCFCCICGLFWSLGNSYFQWGVSILKVVPHQQTRLNHLIAELMRLCLESLPRSMKEALVSRNEHPLSIQMGLLERPLSWLEESLGVSSVFREQTCSWAPGWRPQDPARSRRHQPRRLQ